MVGQNSRRVHPRGAEPGNQCRHPGHEEQRRRAHQESGRTQGLDAVEHSLPSRYEPDERRASYAYVLLGRRAAQVEVEVKPATGGGSVPHVTYRITALHPEEDAAVRAFAAGFDDVLAGWEEAIRSSRKA